MRGFCDKGQIAAIAATAKTHKTGSRGNLNLAFTSVKAELTAISRKADVVRKLAALRR